jgi:hypothetical protein
VAKNVARTVRGALRTNFESATLKKFFVIAGEIPEALA